jgi:hypothetical protein
MLTHFFDWLLDRPACYRVKYPDGKITHRMCVSYAKNLIQLYGGSLIYDPPEKHSKKEVAQ